MLKCIRISDLGLVFVNDPQYSEDVVKSQDACLLGVVVPPSDFFLDHVPDLIIELHVIHLLFQNVLIVKIKLCHIGADVLIDLLAGKDHFNLSLTPCLIHDIAYNVSTKNVLTSISESKVHKNILDLFELIKLML